MTITSTVIIPFDQDPLNFKAGATFSAPDKQSFSDLDDLELSLPASNRYATFEPNFWILDGNYKFMPASPIIGYMSSSMSNGSTTLTSPPILTITLASVFSTVDGLTLYFSPFTNDWADSITIRYYDNSLVLFRTDSYTPTGATFATNQAVSSFRKVEIEFASTNKASRWVRLTGIDLDTFITLEKENIKEARLIEEINPVAVELPINTIDVTLFSDDPDFSIIEPSGFYEDLQYRAPFDIYELVDGEQIYMGRFYLEEWESKGENEIILRMIDLIGILDQIPFLGKVWASPSPDVLASTAFPFVFDDAGVGTGIISLDSSLNSKVVYGFIPATNYRDALQLMCIGIGAYATCARSNVINVRPLEIAADLVSFDFEITREDKGIESPVKLRTLVTGIEIISHEYFVGDGTISEVAFDGDLAVGTHIIIFTKPAYDIEATGSGGFGGSGDFQDTYIIYTVTSGGHLLLEINPHIQNKNLFSLYNTGLPAGTRPNVIRIDEATTIHPEIAADIVQGYYDYYEQRYIQKTKLFASLVAPGDSMLIDTQIERQIQGIVERMTTDLARGMVQEVDIIGVVAP